MWVDVLQGDPASPTVVAHKVDVLSTVRCLHRVPVFREVVRSHAENVFRWDDSGARTAAV